MKENKSYTGLEIAIIGMSGRFPGASSVKEFWNNLAAGNELITHYSEKELRANGITEDILTKGNYIGAVGKLTKPEWFDSGFFGFSHTEAEVMDPQMRIMLECAYETFQDAGYNPFTFKGYVGVFTGASSNELWEAKTILSGKEAILGQFETEFLKNKDFLSAHISYRFNLKGPSFSLFTACSTSLTAVHLACQALLNGECEMALAGGVSVNLVETFGYQHQDGMILSNDGHCKPFDKNSSGTISGDGAGVVLLKPLVAALRDGDNIYATILASGINNDGNNKIGFTAPSLSGQVDLIKTVYQLAEIEADTIGYIEAHGTATNLGDPIEFEALTQAFATDKKQFCALGSVKSNVGHLDAAAGITGLIKVALSLKHQLIPATLHFTEQNPHCNFSESPFYVNNTSRNWEKNNEYNRRAAVSSLGIGGSNAHLVLEEVPVPARKNSTEPQLLLVSAKSAIALSNSMLDHADYLKTNSPVLSDVAHTLAYGRETFPWRTAVFAENLEEAIDTLQRKQEEKYAVLSDNTKKLVYLFSGQGSQYSMMYADLYNSLPAFQKQVDQCLSLVSATTKEELTLSLFNPDYSEALKQTKNTQLALFICEYALVKYLETLSLSPNAMIGHSIGEYVAACIAGVIDLKSAIKLVELRGELMQKMPSGKMLNVGLSKNEIQKYVNGKISLAVVNSEKLCVLSGEDKAIDEVADRLTKEGVFVKQLHTSHAFHSYLMDTMLSEFEMQLQTVEFNKPNLPYLSNYTGGWINFEDVSTPSYWVRHLRDTVLFNEGVDLLLSEGNTVFLEIGPGNFLGQLVSSNHKIGEKNVIIQLVRKYNQEANDLTFLNTQLAKVWETGINVNLSSLIPSKGNKISLPTYPFERERYWIDGNIADWFENASVQPAENKLPVKDWFYKIHWKRVEEKITEIKKAQTVLWLSSGDEDSFLENGIQENTQKTLIKIFFGNKFDITGNTIIINPSEKADFIQLMREMKSRNIIPDKIIHSVTLQSYTNNTDAKELLTIFKRQALLAVINLCDALSQAFPSHEINIDILTRGRVDVIGDEPLNAASALLTGILPVIHQENNKLKATVIDIDAGSMKKNNAILNYLIFKENKPTDITIRNSHVWKKEYENYKINDHQPLIVRANDVFVITGGLGNIGLKMANYFANEDACSIYLLTRNELSANDSRAAVIENIRSLGANVYLKTVDMTDEKLVKDCLDEIYNQSGKITGVIHAAANMRDCIQLIGQLNSEEINRIVDTKILGAIALDKALQERNIDFVLCMSSLATELGGLGYAAYAASNAYLDLLVRKKRNLGINWMSVNWDGWQGNTNDKGNSLSIDINEGKEALGILLNRFSGQTIISTTLLESRRKQWISEENGTYVSSNAPAVKKYPRPELSTPYEAPVSELEKAITVIWENFFLIENIGVNDDFFALGGDSLKGMILVNRYKELLNEMVYVSLMFEATTISQIVRFFEKHYPQAAARINGAEIIQQENTLSTITAERVKEITGLLPPVEPNLKGERNKKAVFIISSSRSGSTLLRVMMAGNPQLFAPPELELLNYYQLQGEASSFQGLIRSLMQVCSYNALEATQKVEEMIRDKWPTKEIYSFIQKQLNNQLLVEKTPSYSFNKSILEKAEAEFNKPIFIHLVRHPYGMIHSKKNAKLDLLTAELASYFRTGQELGEFEWVLANRNIKNFLNNIEKDRQLMVRYEDLVDQPEKVAQEVCKLIGIEFDEGMLNPYADSSKLMTDGIHKQSIMIGDPKFHTHKSISKENSYVWRKEVIEDFLHQDTLAFAKEFGYLSIQQMNAKDQQKFIENQLYPVTSQQRKLLIYQDLFAETTNYNIPRAIKVENLDRAIFERAVKSLCERHDILRTTFLKHENTYYQKCIPEVNVSVEWVILTAQSKTEEEILNSLVVPFNLSHAPLLKVSVIDRGQSEFVIYFDTHHILTDAISQNILIRELIQLYLQKKLSPVSATYHEYAMYQNTFAFRKKLKEQEEFWLKQFITISKPLKLELDYLRPEILQFHGSEIVFHLEGELHGLFDHFSLKEGVSRYILALSIYQLFLYKITQQEDITIGTPVTQRPEKRFEETIGMFVNTLPVRFLASKEKTIKQFINESKQTVIDLFRNADYSIDDLVNKLHLPRDFSRNPLFDSMFVFQNFEVTDQNDMESLHLDFVKFGEKISRYDMSCVFFDYRDAFEVHFEYNTNLFKKERITEYVAFFKQLWQQVLSNPDQRIGDIDDFIGKQLKEFINNSVTQDLEIEFNF